MNFFSVIFKYSVSVHMKYMITAYIIKSGQIKLLKEIIVTYSENYTKNTLYG